MPNLVNEILLDELSESCGSMGSCLVVSFDRLTVEQAGDIRKQFRDSGVRLLVTKNRLAVRAFQKHDLDMTEAFQGKCGIVFAPEEQAISAAKIVREATAKQKEPTVVVTGGVIEGEAITGPAAAGIADMPDKHTVRGMLAGGIAAVARGLASCVQAAGPGGVARVIQANIDAREGDGGAGTPAPAPVGPGSQPGGGPGAEATR